MIVMFFLGVAAGMLNVWRAVSGMGMAVGYRRRGGDNAGSKRKRDPWDDEDADVAIELHPLHQFTIERIVPLHIGSSTPPTPIRRC